jgi:hypothetical protein
MGALCIAVGHEQRAASSCAIASPMPDAPPPTTFVTRGVLGSLNDRQ